VSPLVRKRGESRVLYETRARRAGEPKPFPHIQCECGASVTCPQCGKFLKRPDYDKYFGDEIAGEDSLGDELYED
jgi:hypothetical protein